MMKQTTGERIFNAINLVLLGLLTIICILPFVYVIALSLSSSEAIIANRVRLLPVDFQLDAYKSVFTSKPMIQSLLFTSLLTVVGTAGIACYNAGVPLAGLY
jgi:putative aldouronate transport system permease protein